LENLGNDETFDARLRKEFLTKRFRSFDIKRGSGSLFSPVLANMHLHHLSVLDRWKNQGELITIRPLQHREL